ILEHALRAPPVEQAFDQEFKDEFQAVAREFARHFREKGWTQTQFQFYLNNKYYYRDPKQGGYGSYWWLLDEPMHRDDWLALRFFGKLFRGALGESGRAGEWESGGAEGVQVFGCSGVQARTPDTPHTSHTNSPILPFPNSPAPPLPHSPTLPRVAFRADVSRPQ